MTIVLLPLESILFASSWYTVYEHNILSSSTRNDLVSHLQFWIDFRLSKSFIYQLMHNRVALNEY
jgi:hypothetical protein